MSWDGWLVFAGFWVLFVTTPGPNAVNCIQNGLSLPFGRAVWGILGILTQATAFLLLSAAGVTAMIVAAPELFYWARIAGAGVLIWLGLRGWINARRLVAAQAASADTPARTVYLRALAIATINAKSLAGYLAAFTQFVQPDVPVWSQMWTIMPTALILTTLSYTGYTLLGAGLGRLALGAIMHLWVRRGMAACFLLYGIALGASTVTPGRA